MLTVFKWVFRGFLALLVVCVLMIAVIFFLLNSSLPDYSATHRVKGLSAPVQIVRGEHAVPHIFGETDRDSFFGLGFAHAQDRLWQMVILRRASQGRLSEIFGERTVPTDRLLRRLDLHGLSVVSHDRLSESGRDLLQAYSNGINAWLEIVDRSVFNPGAPEFLLFDFEIRPWQPSDSLAIMKLQAFELSVHAQNEALRARAAARLTAEQLADLMPDAPRMILPDLTELALPDPAVTSGRGAGAEAAWLTAARQGGASNVWAASSDRAAARKTLFANDPHLGFSAPSIWMLARLELSTGGVIGGTIPGMPAMPVGRSAHLAWGVTSSYLDDQDLYFEQLDPDDGSRYLTPFGFREFRTMSEVINVKDGPPVNIDLAWTENGPVLPAEYFGIEDIVPEDHVVSLAWTALSPEDTSMDSVLNLMRSTTIDEALDTGSLLKAPSLNLVVADGEGMAMQLAGVAPRRHLFHETRGRRPSPGWKFRNRWQGELEYSQLPRVRNPASGWLANTNNRLVDQPFPEHVSHYWGDTQRIARLAELLRAGEIHSKESFQTIQLDTISYPARTLTALLTVDLWHSAGAPSDDPAVELRNRAINLLRNWNGGMDEHLPEPLIYSAWILAVQKHLVQDDLGDLFEEFRQPDPVFLERVYRDFDGASRWCDVLQSTPVETCLEIKVLALDEALANLKNRYGGDIGDWRWGDAHLAMHDHQILGGNWLFSWLVNLRQSTSGGEFTINRGASEASEELPFASTHGAGYRGVYDFSDPDSSAFVISTGQSGHPWSRHYDDLGALWRNGEYIVMSLDPDDIHPSATGTIILEPVP